MNLVESKRCLLETLRFDPLIWGNTLGRCFKINSKLSCNLQLFVYHQSSIVFQPWRPPSIFDFWAMLLSSQEPRLQKQQRRTRDSNWSICNPTQVAEDSPSLKLIIIIPKKGFFDTMLFKNTSCHNQHCSTFFQNEFLFMIWSLFFKVSSKTRQKLLTFKFRFKPKLRKSRKITLTKQFRKNDDLDNNDNFEFK